MSSCTKVNILEHQVEEVRQVTKILWAERLAKKKKEDSNGAKLSEMARVSKNVVIESCEMCKVLFPKHKENIGCIGCDTKLLKELIRAEEGRK